MNRGLYVPHSVYTRRQSSDVFHNDPFKIHSYNFHYADRPSYPVQHYQRPAPPPPEPAPFKTYFYNAKFHSNAESTPATTTPATSSLAENRRRQFLHDFKRVLPPSVTTNLNSGLKSRERLRQPVASLSTIAANPSPLLRICCNRDDYQAMRRGQSATTVRQSPSELKAPAKQPSQCSTKLPPRRTGSTCSGCTININIRSIDSEVDVNKSLKIKIETDKTDKMQAALPRRCCSSKSFVIDKNLSKFSVSNAQSQKDALQAKRLQLQSERERLERVQQQELLKEQQRAKQRAQERERLRQAERQRDHERLLQLEAEREAHRVRDLERQTQRRREREMAEQLRREAQQQQQQRKPMRAMSSAMRDPVVMKSHLQTSDSSDRLPGMAPCHVRPAEATRAERLQKCTRNLSRLQKICSAQNTATSTATKTLERRSSNTSNFNAAVQGNSSNLSLRNERKLLNLKVNGKPVTSTLPIHTRINNMPIRITTSQPQDEHLRFSVNRVTASELREQSQPSAGRSSSVTRRGSSKEPPPCSVNINVYADNPRK